MPMKMHPGLKLFVALCVGLSVVACCAWILMRGTSYTSAVKTFESTEPFEDVYAAVELIGTSCFDIAHCGKEQTIAKLESGRIFGGKIALKGTLQSPSLVNRRNRIVVYKPGYTLAAMYGNRHDFKYQREYETLSEWRNALKIRENFVETELNNENIYLIKSVAKGKNRLFELHELMSFAPRPAHSDTVGRLVCDEMLAEGVRNRLVPKDEIIFFKCDYNFRK
jgi:hypothetical protein